MAMALTNQGVDAKSKKRGGRKFTDCTLLFRDSLILDTAGDNRVGTIKIPGNYANVMPKGACIYNVNAPKDCKLEFTIKQIELESGYDVATCHRNDNIFIKWGRKYSGHLCGNHQPLNKFNKSNPKYKNLATDLAVAQSYNTGKNRFSVKFNNDGDAAGSTHTDAFELAWSCAEQ